MPELKTVEQHNAERIAAFSRAGELQETGIACPKCANELFRRVIFMGFGENYHAVVGVCPSCHHVEYIL